ncbi:MAG: SH3 domain-containing protein [Bacteroidota bacterium]
MTLALLLLLAMGPDGPESLRQQGLDLLAEGDTLGAVATLDAAVAGEWTNPDVWLALGQTHLAREATGPAVLALERAARSAPLDPEIASARRDAHALARAVPPEAAAPVVAARAVRSTVGTEAVVALALVLYLGLAALSFVWWRRRQRPVGWAALALAPVALCALILAGLTLWDASGSRAVALASVEVRARPVTEAETVGSVRTGEMVTLGPTEGDWRRVTVDETEGWVPSRAVSAL